MNSNCNDIVSAIVCDSVLDIVRVRVHASVRDSVRTNVSDSVLASVSAITRASVRDMIDNKLREYEF